MSDKETVIDLPDDGIISTEWARKALEKAELFSAFGLNANKGRVFFMLSSELSPAAYEQSVVELEYTVETANLYIRFLQKLPVLEAIRTKYYAALSLSASELIPDDIEDAFALMDICLARVGKPTAKNLAKALEISGKSPKKMSDSAISVETLKKKALHEWLLDEHGMSEDDIYTASKLHPEGRTEFTEKMAQAFFLLEDWQLFYNIIATPVHDSGDPKALRFLADIQDASGSIMEYLKAETAYQKLASYKEVFENEVYPKLSFEASKDT
jgi:hypothetical protein